MSGGDSDWRARLRHEREQLGLTQAGLGTAAGLSPEAIRKYESGARTPNRGHLLAILGVLQVPQVRARGILAEAGFSAAEQVFPTDAHPGYFYTLEEASAEIERMPWPQFVVDNVMEIAAANRAASLLWGVDLAAELAGRERSQLHFLALIAEPRFANFEECLAMVVGVLKGVPDGGAAIDAPGPWAEQVLGQFAANNPGALASLLHVWERTAARPPKSRWTYRIVWREPEGEMRFTGVVSTASEPDGLSFNDWIPADAESHAILELVLAGRSTQEPAPSRRASGGKEARTRTSR